MTEQQDENTLITQRREKLQAMREQGTHSPMTFDAITWPPNCMRCMAAKRTNSLKRTQYA